MKKLEFSDIATQLRETSLSLNALAYLLSNMDISTDSEIYSEDIPNGLGYLILQYAKSTAEISVLIDEYSLGKGR